MGFRGGQPDRRFTRRGWNQGIDAAHRFVDFLLNNRYRIQRLGRYSPAVVGSAALIRSIVRGSSAADRVSPPPEIREPGIHDLIVMVVQVAVTLRQFNGFDRVAETFDEIFEYLECRRVTFTPGGRFREPDARRRI